MELKVLTVRCGAKVLSSGEEADALVFAALALVFPYQSWVETYCGEDSATCELQERLVIAHYVAAEHITVLDRHGKHLDIYLNSLGMSLDDPEPTFITQDLAKIRILGPDRQVLVEIFFRE